LTTSKQTNKQTNKQTTIPKIKHKQLHSIIRYAFYSFFSAINKRKFSKIKGFNKIVGLDIDSHLNWKINDSLEIYEILPGLQRHGLSVMINLFRAIKFCEELGYTHFQRIEVDALMGEESINFMKKVPFLCEEENKKCLFYFNEDDVSFHYFFSEIKYFLENINEIKTENDYIKYINENFGERKFKIVEQYLKHNLDKSISNVYSKNNEQMIKDFPDTEWNTETSESNIQNVYNGCTTELYKVLNSSREELDNLAILSYNYRDLEVKRKIVIYKNDGEIEVINHHLITKNSWTYNLCPKNIEKIEIYENDELSFEKINNKIESYIILK
jgi:hypothetical protein